MARRKPLPEIVISIGPPILKHGIAWQVAVPGEQAEVETVRLVKLALAVEGKLPDVPVPHVEMVPGGTPADGTAGVYDTEGRRGKRVGY